MTATFSTTHRKQANPLQIAPLFRWLLFALALAACGLLYVYVKNQQHFLGEQTRKVEREIREMRTRNEVLLARVSALSSHAELQRKLDQGLIALQPIKDQNIARLTPPVAADKDGIVRTAANEGYRQ